MVDALTSSKTPATIVAEIKMMSAAFRGIQFLVEGTDDSKFWKLRVASGRVSIVSCEGKTNLLRAGALVAKQGISSVAGVYDADFDYFFGEVHSPALLAPTDENDLEVTILASEAIKVLLIEYADTSRISNFETLHGITPTQHLERISREFGKLRFLNRLHGHRVDFDRLSPYRFVSQVDWMLDLVGLHREYASLAGISLEQLDSDLHGSLPVASAWGLCHGHDSVRILAQGLRGIIGGRQISEQDLAKVLRISYSREMLQNSRMYKLLKAIEATLPCSIFE